MTAVDWVIVALALCMAAWGYQQGLIVGALTLGGFAVGAFAGSRLGPALLAGGSKSAYAPLSALIGALLVGGIVAVSFEGLGRAMRARFVTHPRAAVADGLGGAVLIGALGLAFAWLLGAVALHTPGTRTLRQDIQRSAILQRLNNWLPPSGPLIHALNRIDPTPTINGPSALVRRPNAAIARDPDVDRAGRSVVRVIGTACGLGIAGSGWVAAPGLVVTDAHVVAGEQDTQVTTRDGSATLSATPVHFDPHNDVALLRVAGLQPPPLSLGSNPRRGAAAAVLGYPENGPFAIAPARIGGTQHVITQDAYGEGPTDRLITSFRGRVIPGNSGGPAVDAAGRVATTVFAGTTSGRPGGFGVPNSIVRAALRKGAGAVGTGACTG